MKNLLSFFDPTLFSELGTKIDGKNKKDLYAQIATKIESKN